MRFCRTSEWSTDTLYDVNERSVMKTACCISHLHEVPRPGKSTETQSHLEVAGQGQWSVTAGEHGVSLRAVRTLRWGVMVAQACEHTENL